MFSSGLRLVRWCGTGRANHGERKNKGMVSLVDPWVVVKAGFGGIPYQTPNAWRFPRTHILYACFQSAGWRNSRNTGKIELLPSVTEMYQLILLRHGESEWNQANKFGGWTDLKLSHKGQEEAREAGRKLARNGYLPPKVYTSKLTRAIQTSNRVLEECDRLWVDVVHTYRLNERHYGALQGRNKEEVEKQFGHEKYMLWRRSLDVAPPPIDPDDEYSQVHDSRYAELRDAVPLTENLHTMTDRIRPVWTDSIAADLRQHGSILIIGHGNSLRGLIKIVRRVSNEEIKHVDIATGQPMVITLDENLEVSDPENWFEYLH